MAGTGFDGLEELDSFVSEMLDLAEKEMPRESSKFLKKNAGQLARATKNKAKQLGVMEETGNYYNGFKSGKVYKYDGALSCRSYNGSPHAHLIEYGHLQTDKSGKSAGKGFVPGFHPFQRAREDFISKYYNNCEQFIDDMINKHGL